MKTKLTITHLNLYYPFIKTEVEQRLKEVDENVSEDIITKAIQSDLKLKMMNEKELLKEIEGMYNDYSKRQNDNQGTKETSSDK